MDSGIVFFQFTGSVTLGKFLILPISSFAPCDTGVATALWEGTKNAEFGDWCVSAEPCLECSGFQRLLAAMDTA